MKNEGRVKYQAHSLFLFRVVIVLECYDYICIKYSKLFLSYTVHAPGDFNVYFIYYSTLSLYLI